MPYLFLKGKQMPKFSIIRKHGDFDAITKQFKVSECIARLLVNRGIESFDDIEYFLNGSINDLGNPFDLDNMDIATNIINDAIKCNKKFRVIGDYDVDGVMATYILCRGLELVGANVSYDIPHRVSDGYGLNERLVRKCIDDNIDVIITVDNGIAAPNEIKLATDNEITVIVTDHHQPQEIIPNCDAIINPHMNKSKEIFSEICGTFVAFKLVQGIYRKNNISKVEEEKLINYVALATVGDSMPLINENRIVVKYGLEHLQEIDNMGIRSLMKVQEIMDAVLTTYHIGFIINPCINASGRLDSAMKSLELLMCNDEIESMRLASEIKDINNLRKDITEKCTNEVIAYYESNDLPKVIVYYLDNCHESIAGIVAGHVKEHFNRPTIILTSSEGIAKGSARSIEGYDIFSELMELKNLFIKFGGHKMAAGMSLEMNNIDKLRNLINDRCKLTDSDFEKKILIDMPYPFGLIRETAISELNLISPCGEGNPRPLFCADKVVVNSYTVRGKGKVLALVLIKDNIKVNAVYFGDVDNFINYIEENNHEIKIVFSLSVNVFNNIKTNQIDIKYYT